MRQRHAPITTVLVLILLTLPLIFRIFASSPATPPLPSVLEEQQSNALEFAPSPPRDERTGLAAIASVKSHGDASSGGDLVSVPGVPLDAHKWASTRPIESALDLPVIYPHTLADLDNATKVCVFNRAPRQRSLWSADVLALFGSGRFRYVSMDATDCQFHGICASPEETRKHPECKPNVMPTVGLVEWVKCCFHDRFERVLKTHRWDVAVATGDEYCAAHESPSSAEAQFRFYYSGQPGASYLPLGPREEFRRVKPQHVLLADKRRYLFNFVGSLTSPSRRRLSAVLNTNVIPPGGRPAFLHIVSEWSREAKQSNGYILPSEYRKVIINSTFTLCPDGHNPEAYRLFEACEAGSIPIVAMDQYYTSHPCQHAFAPFIQSGAPFVYLNGWRGLGPFLKKMMANPAELRRMQANVMDWYSKYMRAKATEFESVLVGRFERRRGGAA